MTFEQLRVCDKFRIIDPNPNDPTVYIKTGPMMFVEDCPDGDVFIVRYPSDFQFLVEHVGHDYTPSRN